MVASAAVFTLAKAVWLAAVLMLPSQGARAQAAQAGDSVSAGVSFVVLQGRGCQYRINSPSLHTVIQHVYIVHRMSVSGLAI
jgi:uncharacterized membrane protein YhhN